MPLRFIHIATAFSSDFFIIRCEWKSCLGNSEIDRPIQPNQTFQRLSMTTAQPSLLQLAKQGDPSAISSLMNQSLPKGITAKVSLKDDCLKVMLESVEVPEQRSCVEFVRKGIANLNIISIQQVKVYGRETGEDFPSWQEDFEIILSDVPDTTELARQGDLEAINTLFTQWLDSSGVTSKVTLKNDCLRVMLESSEFPDQSALTSQIFERVKQLNLQNCSQLKISGREPGDEFPDWQKDFDLTQDFDLVQASQSLITNCLQLPTELEVYATALFAEPVQEPIPQELTPPQPKLLELARTGDVQAITNVMNYLLESKGLTVSATIKGECLLVAIQSDCIPDQEQSITYLRKVLDEMKLSTVKQVKVYARRKGSTFTAWTQDLNLESSKQGDFFGSIFGAVAGAAGAVGGAAAYAGGAVTGAVTGAAGAVGSAAMQATDGVGYVLHMVSDSPQLQGLTKNLKLDKFIHLIDKVDVVKAETHVKKLQRKYPNEKPADIAHRVMMEKAIYVGGSGFASSLTPGFAAAMFAVDLAATMALQAEMVYQIACAYGLNLHEPARKGEVLAIFGIALGGNYALKAGLGLARNIPFAGAVIGASGNAAMLYAMGYAACRFYEAKLNPFASTDSALSEVASDVYLQDAIKQQVIMDQILVHLVLAGCPGKNLQQILPNLQSLNLSPASLETITANPKALPPLDKLLEQLNRDFAVSLVAQCRRIAQADGVITPQEARILKMISQKFDSN